MAVTKYDAKDWSVTVDGVNITQLGEDMFSMEKQEALFEPKVGAQGDVIKSKVNNELHDFKLSVQPTCPQLKFLMGLEKRDTDFPIWATNKKLGIRLGGTKACVSEAPEYAFGTEAEDLEFSFCVFNGVKESIK